MGGSSLGSMFGGPSTIGSNKYAPANTTPSVMGAQGKLEAFNPTTMAGTYNSTASTPTMENFTGAGLDAASGLPTYVTNFLQQGGTGTLKAPQFTMEGTGVEQAGTAGSQVMKKANIPIAPGGVPPPKTTTAGATSSTPGQSATGITQIPFNAPGGYNPLGSSGSGQSGFYNPQLGYDAGAGTPQSPMNPGGKGTVIGGPDGLPAFMGGPIYTDGKGGYFTDATGKTPLTGLPLTLAQGVGKQFGYA